MGEPASVRWVTVLAGMALFAACTGGSSPDTRGSGPSATPTTPSATSPPAEPFVRTCEDNVYGDLGFDWRDRSVVVGAIAFVGLPFAATAPRSDFTPDKGGFKRVKALAVVDRGTEVTVIIPPDERGHVALVYDPAAFDSTQIADGETSVNFHACGKGEGGFPGPTQFNGGFIVDGPQCATIDVLNAANGLWKRVNVAFGRGACASG